MGKVFFEDFNQDAFVGAAIAAANAMSNPFALGGTTSAQILENWDYYFRSEGGEPDENGDLTEKVWIPRLTQEGTGEDGKGKLRVWALFKAFAEQYEYYYARLAEFNSTEFLGGIEWPERGGEKEEPELDEDGNGEVNQDDNERLERRYRAAIRKARAAFRREKKARKRFAAAKTDRERTAAHNAILKAYRERMEALAEAARIREIIGQN